MFGLVMSRTYMHRCTLPFSTQINLLPLSPGGPLPKLPQVESAVLTLPSLQNATMLGLVMSRTYVTGAKPTLTETRRLKCGRWASIMTASVPPWLCPTIDTWLWGGGRCWGQQEVSQAAAQEGTQASCLEE